MCYYCAFEQVLREALMRWLHGNYNQVANIDIKHELLHIKVKINLATDGYA